MKTFLRLFLMSTFLFSLNSFAQECEDDSRPNHRRERERERDRVSSSCSASSRGCGDSDGNSGSIPACSITCYDNESAICTEGSFSTFNSCEVESYNSCYCY